MKAHAKPAHYTVRGVPREVDQALGRRAAKLGKSLNQVIVDELTRATLGPPRRADFSNLLGRWAKATVDVLTPGRETAENYARLFVQLKRAGTPIPDNDLWVAALVLQHDLRLITRDEHFERVPQILLG